MASLNAPKNIIITGDLMRVCPVSKKPNQTTNIIWFATLTKCFIELVFPEVPIKVIVSDDNNVGFSASEIYEAENLPQSVAGWGALYDCKDLSTRSIKIMDECFHDSLIVGIELPNVFKNYYEKESIPYFDFSLHSIRFADDLLFSLDTNSAESKQAIESYYVGGDLFSTLAAVHMATLSRVPRPTLKKDACLLVGQTEYDKVLIDKGEFVSLLDYENEINELLKKHSVLYFKPHPYCIDKSLNRKIAKYYGVEILKDNIYKYLGCEEITSVASISSSVVHEARYFSKESLAFKRGHTFEDQALSTAFLSTGFWRALLSNFFHPDNNFDSMLPPMTSRLRKSIGSYWGYDFFEYKVVEAALRSKNNYDFLSLRYYLPLAWRQKLAALLRL